MGFEKELQEWMAAQEEVRRTKADAWAAPAQSGLGGTMECGDAWRKEVDRVVTELKKTSSIYAAKVAAEEEYSRVWHAFEQANAQAIVATEALRAAVERTMKEGATVSGPPEEWDPVGPEIRQAYNNAPPTGPCDYCKTGREGTKCASYLPILYMCDPCTEEYHAHLAKELD